MESSAALAKKGEARWWGLSKMIIGRNFNDSSSGLMLELDLRYYSVKLR